MPDITCSKNGLSESELQDVLACDDEVLNDVFQRQLFLFIILHLLFFFFFFYKYIIDGHRQSEECHLSCGFVFEMICHIT